MEYLTLIYAMWIIPLTALSIWALFRLYTYPTRQTIKRLHEMARVQDERIAEVIAERKWWKE